MNAYYCTLAQARAELKAETTVDDAKLLFNIALVSSRIDLLFQSPRPYFEAYDEAIQIEANSQSISSYRNALAVDVPMLAIASVAVGGASVTTEPYPRSRTPFFWIRMTDYSTNWYAYCNSDPLAPMYATITGTFGVHRRYANAWLKVDDLAGNVTASATSLTVADVDGADPHGRIPRISAGNLIRVGTEYMRVLETVIATNVVTVERGVNGSTAAAHSTGDDVDVWEWEQSINRVTIRQAALLYARRGAFETTSITDVGVTTYPSDLLGELRGVIQGYVYD